MNESLMMVMMVLLAVLHCILCAGELALPVCGCPLQPECHSEFDFTSPALPAAACMPLVPVMLTWLLTVLALHGGRICTESQQSDVNPGNAALSPANWPKPSTSTRRPFAACSMRV